MTKKKDLESITGKTAVFILVSGKEIKCMELEKTGGMMEKNMLEIANKKWDYASIFEEILKNPVSRIDENLKKETAEDEEVNKKIENYKLEIEAEQKLLAFNNQALVNSNEIINKFKTFFDLNKEDFEKNINYSLDLIGKDGLHPGPAIHYSYFTFFKKIFQSWRFEKPFVIELSSII